MARRYERDYPQNERSTTTAARVFGVLALIARTVGIVFCVLVIISYSGWVTVKLHATSLTFAFTHLLPDFLAGKWVIPTPLDGLFRTDFALAGVFFLLLDWFLTKLKDRW